MATHKILVYSEDNNILPELLGKAQQVGAEAVVAVIRDTSPAGGCGKNGAETVYYVTDPVLKEFNPETYTAALAGIIAHVKPDLVMVGATKQGLELSARVAERMEMSLASWCVDFEMDAEGIVAQCMIYSGIGINTYRLKTKPAMITVSGGVFEAPDGSGEKAEVVPVSVDIQAPKLTVIEEKGKMAVGKRL